MKKETYNVVVEQEDYNDWVSSMLSHKTFITPQWIVDSINTPCSILAHSWDKGVATIEVCYRDDS